MKIKPSKPDEHGVRWCDSGCHQYKVSAEWQTKCDALGYEMDGHVCEFWAQKLVETLDHATHVLDNANSTNAEMVEAVALSDALRLADEIEVE